MERHVKKTSLKEIILLKNVSFFICVTAAKTREKTRKNVGV